MMMAGTRSTPYSAALSLSSTRFSTSSVTSGSSAAICSSTRRVGAHISHPIDCSKKMRRTTYHLLEEIIECLAGAAGRLRLGLRARFALDGDARRKQLAGIANVLRRDPHGNFLRALERPRGIERLALRARPKVRPAARAAGIGGDRRRQHVAAPRAPHHLVKPRDARRTSLEC